MVSSAVEQERMRKRDYYFRLADELESYLKNLDYAFQFFQDGNRTYLKARDQYRSNWYGNIKDAYDLMSDDVERVNKNAGSAYEDLQQEVRRKVYEYRKKAAYYS